MVAAVQRTQELDYYPCRYGNSRIVFRGPKRDLSQPYISVVGGSETFGRFVECPYPDLLEARLGVPVVNLGCLHAGLTAFQNDSTIIEVASGSVLTVVQVVGAHNMSNRFYRVHPRRNDRFLVASDQLQERFPGVDFTEFHFTRHLLQTLSDADPEAFSAVVRELRTAWTHRMLSLLGRIRGPKLLLWMSDRPLAQDAVSPTDADPLFVDRRLVEAVAGEVEAVVEVSPDGSEPAASLAGKIYDDPDRAAAGILPGPKFHADVAAKLEVAIFDLVGQDVYARRAV